MTARLQMHFAPFLLKVDWKVGLVNVIQRESISPRCNLMWKTLNYGGC